MASVGQQEQERAFQAFFDEVSRGVEEEAKKLDGHTERERRNKFRLKMVPLYMEILKPVLRELWAAAEGRGQELRGCCDHKEPPR